MKEHQPELELVKVEPELSEQDKLMKSYQELMAKLQILEERIAARRQAKRKI